MYIGAFNILIYRTCCCHGSHEIDLSYRQFLINVTNVHEISISLYQQIFFNLKGEYTSKWHSSLKSSFRYDILRLFKFILLHAEQMKTLLNWGPSLLVTNQNAHTDLKISTFCWISLRI